MNSFLKEYSKEKILEDFHSSYIKDILVETVNLTRATLKESLEFRTKLENDIYSMNTKLIIDLSQCEFIDSSFLGVLVLIKKKVGKLKGVLKVIKPVNFSESMMQYTMTLQLFDTYPDLESAINSF